MLTTNVPARALHLGLAAALGLLGASPAAAQVQQQARSPFTPELERRIAAVEPKVIAWRRDIHEHPELGNREHRTAKLVADHLRALGIEVQTGVAHTGVVGLLKGGRPGPVVLLRADMDALPVTERADVPFASRVRAEYNGDSLGVMHACGHDTHVAILMGVAEALAPMRAELPGTIKFVFQPAEEGPPRGEQGGAKLMVEQGILENPKVDAAFALHINSGLEAGHISYSYGGTYASSDGLRIVVTGKQTHGGYPWNGVDPIVASAHIVTALQTIVSRNVALTANPAVVTIGKITGGVRNNIVPEQVEMLGTIRSLSPADREMIHGRVREIVSGVATSLGATAAVEIGSGTAYPVTVNNDSLLARMLPVLEAAAGGASRVHQVKPVTGAEDFAFIAERVPSVYIRLGGRPASVREADAPAHHTPEFYVDDSQLGVGVRALVGLAVARLQGNQR